MPATRKTTTKKANSSKKELSFDDLLKDVMEHPERVMDPNLTDEQILRLQQEINPYAYVGENMGVSEMTRSAAVSCTNLRANYLRQFNMTSLIGFLFRMADEWEVPQEFRRWVAKGSAARERIEREDKKELAPLTPDKLVIMTGKAHELAKLAQIAAAKAAVVANAVKKIKKKDFALDKNVALLRKADAALAKSRGLQYAAMYEARKQGIACDDRIDAVAKIARRHKEVRAIIDRDPIKRKTAGQMEMPKKAAKKIVTNFLRSWFEFNPDAHVRSAHDEFRIKRNVTTVKSVTTDTADPERLPLEVVRAKAPKPKTTAEAAAFKILTSTQETYNASAHILRDLARSKSMTLALNSRDTFKRYLFPVSSKSEARHAVDVLPPQDTFHRWNYYTEVNMEELRTATDAIYHEKPDLDWAFIIYEFFEGTPEENAEAFRKFRDKHQDEVKADIKHTNLGQWTLLADFKENREKVEFLNKHTEVLKRIFDKSAEDKKLGGDLMRKRVRTVKAKNIKKAGPDAPGLSEYQAQNANSSISNMGAERVIGREEMLRLERAKGDLHAAKELEVLDQCKRVIRELTDVAKVRDLTDNETTQLKNAQKDIVRAYEMLEVPEDAIQVDVWTHDTKKGTFGKGKFYTQAEAPEFIHDEERKMVKGKGKEKAIPTINSVKDLAPHAQAYLASQITQERKDNKARQDKKMLSTEK